MRLKVIVLIGVVLLLSFLGVKVLCNSEPYTQEGKILVSLRKIGHELLLQGGDSSSRILPIEQTDDRTYLIRFEAPFPFAPDNLIRIIDEISRKDNLPRQYLVEVIDGKNELINYSYEQSDSNNLVTHCVGRNQPRANYYLKIQFDEKPGQHSSIANIFPYLILPLAIALLVSGFRTSKKDFAIHHPSESNSINETSITLGDFTYLSEIQVLKSGAERIELSAKEAKILGILATHLNEVVGRDSLLKQVWEDEGVFVGRSLDVFISKLRKKFQSDPKIRIANVHGKGYKLEVSKEEKES